jgi:hypothetical protein
VKKVAEGGGVLQRMKHNGAFYTSADMNERYAEIDRERERESERERARAHMNKVHTTYSDAED